MSAIVRKILLAVKVLVDDPMKHGSFRRHRGEQRRRRSQFHVVGGAEYLERREALDLLRGLGALHQPGSEYRMRQVRLRLLDAADGVVDRRRTASQPLELREDVPHPV